VSPSLILKIKEIDSHPCYNILDRHSVTGLCRNDRKNDPEISQKGGMKMYVVAITGASGSILGLRLMEYLLKYGHEVNAVVSDAAWQTMGHEIFKGEEFLHSLHDVFRLTGSKVDPALLKEYKPGDYFSPAASGTAKFEAVIVAPCSMKTLSAIAHGYSDSLITRAVDVALKEGRRTIVVPRETPMNLIHLENLVAVKRAGAHVVMPVPGFYQRPKTIDDVVDFVVGKILNLLNIDHDIFLPWGQS
jgi:4-hydroxy-3-polyprenylbenzoate decarboxylase